LQLSRRSQQRCSCQWGGEGRQKIQCAGLFFKKEDVFDVFISEQASSQHSQTAGGQKNPVSMEIIFRIDASENIF